MNINRILLMVPPTTRPASFGADRVRVSPFFPLGLGYLAAVLRDRYEVKVLDCLLEEAERGGQIVARLFDDGPATIRYGLMDYQIVQQLMDFKPDVVGVSSIFSASDWDAKNLCRLAKAVDPNIVTVLGGAHAGACAREIMESEPAVDFVVIGEGEESFPALLAGLQDGGNVDGIVLRDEHGFVCSGMKTRYIEDLDTIPFPAWDLVNMDGYLKHARPHDRVRQRPFFPVVSSRGCPGKCGFCALAEHWGHRYRFRSAANVLAEVRQLVDRYGIREIAFEDDNLTANRARAIEICRGLRDIGVSWTIPQGSAVTFLDDELLGEMAAAGCYSVTLAVESGSPRVLRLMKKGVNLKKVPTLVESAHKHGMLCKAFFMLGYPGETKAEIEQTVEYAKSLGLDWAFFSITSALPHTRMWDEALRDGYLDLGDFDPVTSFHRSVIRSPEWSREWLAETRERAISETCFSGNPNITRNPQQAIEDFEYVLSLYPDAPFSAEVRECLERAIVERGKTRA